MSDFQFTCMIAEAGFREKPDYATMDVGAYLDSFVTQNISVVDLLNHISKGDSFANVFSGRAGRREGFVMGSIIAVDMDEGPGASYGSLVRHPYVLAYASLVYPTFSYTPAAPRHRVVFVMDEPIYGEEGYTYAALSLTELFPGADKNCAYAGRTFLGNSKDWPDFYVAEKAVLPIQQLRILARQRKARELEAWHARRKQAPDTEPPGLSELFQKLSPLDPYAFSYDEWVRIGAGLAHTYGDDAFLRFKEWSDRAGKEPLTWAKWKSLTKAHPRPASLGTVFYLLQEKGA